MRRKLCRSAIGFCLLAICVIGSTNTLKAQGPTKEALIETLNTVNSLLQAKKYDEVLNHFQLPAAALADMDRLNRELARMVEIQEISSEGIARLAQDAKFGTVKEVYQGDDRGKMFAERMGATEESAYGFRHEHKDVIGEVMAVWKDGSFKLIRLDDVGKLEPISGAAMSNKVAEAPAANSTNNADANSEAVNEIARAAQELYKLGSYPAAWEKIMEAQRLDSNHSGVSQGIDALISQFSTLGVFTVGVPTESIVGILGEPVEKVDLGKDRTRWLYGHWGVDFQSNRVREIVNLRGATEALFQPTEIVSTNLDGRNWMVGMRRKVKGRVSSFMYIAGETVRNWNEQIVIDRILEASSMGSSDAIAKQQIADDQKAYPNSQHKVLVSDDSSAMIAATFPGDEKTVAQHQLIRIIKGPTDLHRITYTVRSSDPPTQETQKKWFSIFGQATLKPVGK